MAAPRARLRHRVPKHHPASVAPVSSLGGPAPKFKTLLGLGSLGLGSVGSQPPREPAPKPGLVFAAPGALLLWCPPAMARPAALGVAEGTQPQQGDRKPGSQRVIFLSRSSNSHFTPDGTFSRIKLFFQSLFISFPPKPLSSQCSLSHFFPTFHSTQLSSASLPLPHSSHTPFIISSLTSSCPPERFHN